MIVFASNSCWNLWNFRRHMIKQLIVDGHEVVIFANEDQYRHLLEHIGCRFYKIKFSIWVSQFKKFIEGSYFKELVKRHKIKKFELHKPSKSESSQPSTKDWWAKLTQIHWAIRDLINLFKQQCKWDKERFYTT